ncbi:asparagine synthase (glutamine-hydrolyzing) [Oceanibacterium hippocampi]|uniref:asparagine synthase (glutamine-hydrolyzing) n=1 Tax=Oceanibacterium hippocampi TaxID=745714 RepID=A0A1Y5U3E4_9PROT|nr:asparagine synthase (glutamine-hydrolyzing) [Oceanibacterium hippocampi]SLN75868.1 Asparagine synthetase B [glutamine-hydrolyzing] [Oceanibacterium hippocampi]
MCGLVCLWNIDDAALARRMIDRIAHRGPDETGIHSLPGIPAVMAHCRLSIIGTENGSQPIPGEGALLAVNGEIYNHRALRAALGPARFATDSDSEVILHLFADGAPTWIAEPDGMFAFVLATPERVVAGRDPLGIKPLFMARIGDGLAFASELKAFDGLGLDTIAAIEPGTLFDSRHGVRRWFRMPQGAADLRGDEDPEPLWRELRLVLEAAVRKWLVADVEVGSFLSGGLDSSIVAAIAAQSLDRPLKTFSVGMADSPDLVAARAVARHIGAEHHELVFTAEDLAEILPHVIYHLESADTDLVRSALPTHFATTLARRHVKAVLTGEGADELFAGYSYHHAYRNRHRQLADEITRSLGTMHNINLQRVDRITMAQGLEARTPFLDRDLIAFAQSIPASLKMKADSEADGGSTEKWILRKACEDLLPPALLWRKKAQFDEGSGTVEALQTALSGLLGTAPPVDRNSEGRLYERILRERFEEPDFILANAGVWTGGRVAV